MAKKNEKTQCKIFFLKKDMKQVEDAINKWLDCNTIEVQFSQMIDKDQLIIFYKGCNNGESRE
jgi:hypothetical protein